MTDTARERIAEHIPKICADGRPACIYYEVSKCELPIVCRNQRLVADIILEQFHSLGYRLIPPLTLIGDEEIDHAVFKAMAEANKQSVTSFHLGMKLKAATQAQLAHDQQTIEGAK